MQNIGTARIISVNSENARICASAARISTTQGDAGYIFANSPNHSKNSALIEKVMRSGHTSVLEHAVFTIAFSNVSVLVEQFIIEFRLASYTVKSRRYVDFGKTGYYCPDELSGDAKRVYSSHMDFLFGEYNYFIGNGIPKEDARFVLPYSFLSNFYCTVNARELQHILKEIFGGRGSNCQELIGLGNQIYDQLADYFPYILSDIDALRKTTENDNTTGSNNAMNNMRFPHISGRQHIIGSTVDLFQYSNGMSDQRVKDFLASGRVKGFFGNASRLPELAHASFLIRDISLVGLTHIVRHRVQSIIVPPVWSVDPNRFLVPSSISENSTLRDRYLEVFAHNIECIGKLRGHGFGSEAYLALSGNTIDIITSMNARELNLFFKLRCCSRAQWEIRGIATNMLRELRAVDVGVFGKFGPSCFVDGRCPEGRLSCGNIQTEFLL